MYACCGWRKLRCTVHTKLVLTAAAAVAAAVAAVDFLLAAIAARCVVIERTLFGATIKHTCRCDESR
jgi:hypothetical protein